MELNSHFSQFSRELAMHHSAVLCRLYTFSKDTNKPCFHLAPALVIVPLVVHTGSIPNGAGQLASSIMSMSFTQPKGNHMANHAAKLHEQAPNFLNFLR